MKPNYSSILPKFITNAASVAVSSKLLNYSCSSSGTFFGRNNSNNGSNNNNNIISSRFQSGMNEITKNGAPDQLSLDIPQKVCLFV